MASSSSVSSRDDDVCSQLNEALTRRKWQTVLTLLDQGKLNNEQRQRALKETATFCKEKDIIDRVLPRTGEWETEMVLTELVRRRLWKAVSELLDRDETKDLRIGAVTEASKHASDNVFRGHMLKHCPKCHLESVLDKALERGMWSSVGEVLQRGVSEDMHNKAVKIAIENAPESSFVRDVWLSCKLKRYDSLFKDLAAKDRRIIANVVYQELVTHILCKWAGDTKFEHCSDAVFWNFVNHCKDEAFYHFIYEATRHSIRKPVISMRTFIDWDDSFAILFSASFIHVLGREDRNEIHDDPDHQALSEQQENLEQIYKIQDDVICFLDNSHNSGDSNAINTTFKAYLNEWSSKMTRCFERNEPDRRAIFVSLERFLSKYQNSRRNHATDRKLLTILACVPLFEDVQNECIRFQLLQARSGNSSSWGILKNICLARVWENVRRDMFQTAIEKNLSFIGHMTNHTLYDDQRGQALKAAFEGKEWDVFLQLAEHGLLEREARRVHYRVGRYANWKLVRRMFKRGADVTEISQFLRSTFEDKLYLFTKDSQTRSNNQSKDEELTALMQRSDQMTKLERQIRQTRISFEAAVRRSKWGIVLYRVIHSSDSKRSLRVAMALKAAMGKEAWPVVIQLVKRGSNTEQRNLLFGEMVQQVQQVQWGVCRELLEKGVDTDLCVTALPQLMKKNQWTLVARAMEYDVGDVLRRQVMQVAMARREGSVVWQALRYMQQPFSEEERKELFRRAYRHKVWQVLKALVEQKDATGIAHRDTVMQEALEHGEWDVVDHCERHYADINMEDADGHTALQRAARKGQFLSVRKMVARGGNQFPLDTDKYSVLHYACQEKDWDTVKLLVQFHGNINQPSPKSETPLQKLIAHDQIEIMECALFWGQDVSKGITKEGETVLHAACRFVDPSVLYYFIRRGIDPLLVSKKGQTALLQAMFQPSLRKIKECIRLGFSTHQPAITEKQLKLHTFKLEPAEHTWTERLISPFEAAIVSNYPLIRGMLYDSGATSYKELFRLHTVLELPPGTLRGKEVGVLPWLTGDRRRRAELSLKYLREVATTPRTLKSKCRLVISRCLDVRSRRHRDVMLDLPLPWSMKNYVLFSDLTHPDYGKDEPMRETFESDGVAAGRASIKRLLLVLNAVDLSSLDTRLLNELLRLFDAGEKTLEDVYEEMGWSQHLTHRDLAEQHMFVY
ncbi:uncharacterized protein [Littorina saxatilis]|uniref:uncharacterized protein n=1 Tax=Littorina saxatilis TaxID=31220 RepID=UPI0038B5E176